MTEIYSDSVTADYGTDAFSVTMFAGAVGIGLIMLFMILYYRLPGVISAVTIAAYVFVVFVYIILWSSSLHFQELQL